jgi:hypothetical protein
MREFVSAGGELIIHTAPHLNKSPILELCIMEKSHPSIKMISEPDTASEPPAPARDNLFRRAGKTSRFY